MGATGISNGPVFFTLTQACRYHLSRALSAFDNAASSCTLISTDGVRVFDRQAIGFANTYEFDVAGVVLPGTYRFQALGGGKAVEPSSNDDGSGSHSVDLQLSLATSADGIPSANSTGSPAILSLRGDLRSLEGDRFFAAPSPRDNRDLHAPVEFLRVRVHRSRKLSPADMPRLAIDRSASGRT